MFDRVAVGRLSVSDQSCAKKTSDERSPFSDRLFAIPEDFNLQVGRTVINLAEKSLVIAGGSGSLGAPMAEYLKADKGFMFQFPTLSSVRKHLYE
jgi:hypothetical protein